MPAKIEDLDLAPGLINLLLATKTQAPKARQAILGQLLEDLSELAYRTKGARSEVSASRSE